jgi:hypothetical protein
MTTAEVAQHCHVTPWTIRQWRHKHGLPPPLPSPRSKTGNIKYATNRDFFAQIDTPEKAYILGFIVADGSVHKNGKTVDISVKESDAGILTAIARELHCDARLHRKLSAGGYGNVPRTMMRLHLCGRKLASDLNALGVYSGKTVSATYPSIPAHLERHMIRGLWDGDGYVGKGQFSLVGTPAVVDGVTEAVKRHTGRRLKPKWDNGYRSAYGNRSDACVLRWMYQDASISLARKAETFRLYWSEVRGT